MWNCVQYNCVLYKELLDSDPEGSIHIQSQYNSLKSDRQCTQLVYLLICTNVAAAIIQLSPLVKVRGVNVSYRECQVTVALLWSSHLLVNYDAMTPFAAGGHSVNMNCFAGRPHSDNSSGA